MSTAIAKVEPQDVTVAPQTQRGILTKDALREASEQRKLLAEYVKQQMVKGTDFGVIPGTDKPTLLKPGAEKLVDLFRCTPKFALVKTIEDYDRNLFSYTFRVRLFQRDAAVVLAEGYGSANSREGRYRWRNSSRKCPSCGKETIIKGKAEYGGGFLCFAKKGGCGAKYKDTDPAITEQEAGQVENDDVATLANTILKMAKKRALVDGAIALARVSDLFTQDVEDLHGHEEERPQAAAEPSKGKTAKEPLWKGVVSMANDLGFDCGAANKKLWEFTATVTPIPAKDWTAKEFLLIEKAIASHMGKTVPQSSTLASEPEADIPY